MWLDIVIAIIFVLSTAQGYRKGFVYTFIHTAGWILAVILGFAWYPRVAAFLYDKTDYYDSIHKKIAEKVAEKGSAVADPVSDSLPTILRDVLDFAEGAVTNALADGLSGFLFNVISFLVVVIAIRFIFLLLSSLLSKKHNEGFPGFIDGFFGLIAGALKGIILIFLLLALMVPVISLSAGDTLTIALEDSRIAGMLYDNNLIFLIVKDFL